MEKFNISLLFYILLLFSIISCNGQNKRKNDNGTTLKKTEKKIKTIKNLDTQKLEKYKSNNQLKYTENDTVFVLEDQGKSYQEIKNKIGENLKTVNIYDKEKLVLTFEGNRFFNFPIGINKQYNLNGDVIYIKNFDDDFPFGLPELRTKIISEFNIDINIFNEHLFINREFDSSSNKFCYDVSIYSVDGSSYRYIVIDGSTGDTITNTIFKSNG